MWLLEQLASIGNNSSGLHNSPRSRYTLLLTAFLTRLDPAPLRRRDHCLVGGNVPWTPSSPPQHSWIRLLCGLSGFFDADYMLPLGPSECYLLPASLVTACPNSFSLCSNLHSDPSLCNRTLVIVSAMLVSVTVKSSSADFDIYFKLYKFQ